MKRNLVKEWARYILGLIIFSFGVHCTIRANIGLAPWDCLGMGISYHTPLNYGLSMTAVSVAVLIIDLLMHERIGFGTVFDAVLTGNFTQFYNDFSPVPVCQSLWLGILVMVAGMFLMAVGQFFCMSSAQCCGPRDSLLLGLGRRLSRIPVGIVEVLLWAAVLLAGWLLGGPVGIGTVISTFGCGFAMTLVFRWLRFEPRNIQHTDVLQSLRILADKS